MPVGEALAGELCERLPHVGRVAFAHLRECAGPEHFADHGGVGEHRFCLRGEQVEAGGDQRLHGLGQRQPAVGGELPAGTRADDEILVAKEPHELLGEQRVAAGAL